MKDGQGTGGRAGLGPWVQTQVWNHLLFAHWAVDPAVLRPLIPAGLEVDTFEGRAWVGVAANGSPAFGPPYPSRASVSDRAGRVLSVRIDSAVSPSSAPTQPRSAGEP